MVALYQRQVMTEAGLIPNAAPQDVELFKQFMLAAGIFAKALAPFQDPQFKAISFTMAPPLPADPAAAKLVEGKVVNLDDPVALAKVYQRMVKGIA
jgi:hypothetical protein